MVNKKKKSIYEICLDVLGDIAGGTFLAIGVYCFAEMANIAPGGVSGIAIMLKYLFGLPIGIMTLVMNIPLIFLAFKYMGKSFTLQTLKTLLFSTVILDFFVTPFFSQYAGDRMIGSIFAGIFSGIGLACVFWRGSSTAGTDIISYLLGRKYPHLQIGTALMMIDFVILLSSCIVFRNIESGLFGIVALFCQTKVIDGLIYGMDKGKSVMIMSDKNEAIANRIIEEMDHSATFLEGKGAYSKMEANVLFCVVRRREFHALKKIVHEEDVAAFMIVCEAEQIFGEGFKPISE